MDHFIERFRDNPDLAYAARHLEESALAFHGHVFTDHYRDGKLIDHADQGKNTFTTEGMAYLLNIIFGTTSKAASAIFYVGIFKNNVTPALGNTASACLGAAGTYGECQDADYDSPATNKPSYTIASATTATCTNAAAAASYTMNGSLTVYGAFLSTEAAKTATSGVLMCAKKFSASRAVIADDILAVTYAITCTTS
jgi:hypothetical protein